MDIRLALMTGVDIPAVELKAVIHQPTIKEISYIGEQDFFIGIQTLCINKNMFDQGNSLLESTTDFQIFMTIMQEQETQDKKKAVTSFLQLIFPNNQIIFTPNSIILNKQEAQIIIDQDNFNVLQDYIKSIFISSSSQMDQTTFNPVGRKAQEIAQKLMRGRQRVAEQKGESNGSALGKYLSILTIALNAMSLKDCMDLTLYQLYDLVERYGLYLNWDLDIKTRLAGGSSESKPDDWMKNIH